MSQSERFEHNAGQSGYNGGPGPSGFGVPEQGLWDSSQPVNTLDHEAQYHLNLGNNHYNKYLSLSKPAELETAIEHYKKALECNPKLSEGYVKLASALWDKGDIALDTALEYCQKALKLNPANGEANLFLGYFLRRSGKIDEAIQHFKAAIQKTRFKSSKPRIALGVGLLHKAAHGHQEQPLMDRLHLTCQGLTQFSLGCLLLPADNSTLQLFQSALVKDAQVYGVIWTGKMMEWCGLSKLASQFYQWVATAMPHEPMAFHLLADNHYNQHQIDASLQEYEQAVALAPHDVALLKKVGMRYYHQKLMDKAAHYFERALALEPKDFDSLYQLGRIHTDRRDYIRSLYHFKEAFNLEPQNPYIHSHMAYLLFKLEDFDGAIQEYRLAVSYGQDDVWTSTVAQTLGVLYYQVRKDLDAAVGMFQLSFQLNPANLDSMAMLADLYFEQGDLEAAVETYRFIIEHEPNNAECYSYLGYLLWQLDHNDEAIQAYEMALKLDPKNAISLNNLGVIYLDDYGNIEKAQSLFEEAFKLKRDYTLACFNLGRCLESQGEVVQAANQFSAALDLNHLNPELEDKEIQDRLDSLFKTQY